MAPPAQKASLFGLSSSTSAPNRKRTSNSSSKTSDVPLRKHKRFSKSSDSPAPTTSESTPLYREGEVTLGIVTKVGPTFLLATLPGNIIAYINVTNISDELSNTIEQSHGLISLFNYFSIGDVIYGTITLSGSRPHLSLVPSVVNYTLGDATVPPTTRLTVSITAEEEKGFVCNSGLSAPCFLPYSKCSDELRPKLKIGSVLVVTVTKSKRVLEVEPETSIDVPNVKVDVEKLKEEEEERRARLREERLKDHKIDRKSSKITSSSITKCEIVHNLVVIAVDNTGIQVLTSQGPALIPLNHLSDYSVFIEVILEFLKLAFERVQSIKSLAKSKKSIDTVLTRNLTSTLEVLGFDIINYDLVVKECLCLFFPSPTPCHYSLKSTLIDSFKNGNYPSNLSEMKVGSCLYGFIRRIFDDKILISFPNQFTGICKGAGLIDDHKERLTLDQTVLVKVVNINPETNQFSLSFKTEINQNDCLSSSRFSAFSCLVLLEPSLHIQNLPSIGSLVEVFPNSMTEVGGVFSLVTGNCDVADDSEASKIGVAISEDVTVFIPIEHLPPNYSMCFKSTVWVRVLSCRAKIALVEATLLPNLIGPVPSEEKSSLTRGKSKKQKTVVDQGDEVEGNLVHVSQFGLTFSVPGKKRPSFIFSPAPLSSAFLVSNASDPSKLTELFPKSNVSIKILIRHVSSAGQIIGSVSENLENLLRERIHSSVDSSSGQSNLIVGQSVQVEITGKSDSGLEVSPIPGIFGLLRFVDIAHDSQAVDMFLSSHPVGSTVTSHVMSTDPLVFSLVDQPLIKSAVVVCRVIKKTKNYGRIVELPSGKLGVCHVMDLNDDVSVLQSQSTAQINSILSCRLLESYSNIKKDEMIPISLKQSDLIGDDVSSLDTSDLFIGKKVTGVVIGQSESGLFLTLSRHLTARIRPAQMIGSPQIGSIITAHVLSIFDGKISLSMKLNNYIPTPTTKEINQVFDGTVKNITSFGVFVALGLHDSKVNLRQFPTVLVHSSKISDTDDNQLSVGDHVRVKIIHVDEKTKRIFGTLRASEVGVPVDTNPLSQSKPIMSTSISVTSAQPMESEEEMSSDDDSEVDDYSSEDVSEEEEITGAVAVYHSDEEDHVTLPNQTDSESEEEEIISVQKVTQKSNKMIEKQVRIAEESLISNNNLNSAAEIERELVARPKCVELWVQYVAVSLIQADFDLSRDILNRAVDQFNDGSEADRLSIWTVFLNFEHSYGTSQSVDDVIRRMNQAVDPAKGMLAYLKILASDDKNLGLNVLTKFYTSVKKCQNLVEFWTLYYLTSFKVSKISDEIFEDSNENKPDSVFKKALFILPTRFHVDFIIQIATLDFKNDNLSHGRLLFEELISNNSKRSDIWFVYIDQEVSHGSIEFARQLFSRGVTVKFSPKAKRAFFRKWAAFEAQNGDQKAVDRVKEMATLYIESLS
ncbi:hypothetical protein RCL1_001402 [Eukaryota sp. TZLM3-RCL]